MRGIILNPDMMIASKLTFHDASDLLDRLRLHPTAEHVHYYIYGAGNMSSGWSIKGRVKVLDEMMRADFKSVIINY